MIPLLIGLAVQRYAQVEAEDRRQRLLEAMRRYKSGQAGIGRAAVEDLVSHQTPEARAAELASVTAERKKSLGDTVAAVQSSNPTQIAGKLSPDYQRSQQAAAETVAERTRRAIEQLSVMGAPGEQALKSGIRFGRAAGVVDSTNSAIGNVGNGYMGDINNTVPNPGLMLLGKGAMAADTTGFGKGATASTDPEQLSGPGYGDRPATATRVRRAMSLWGR